MYKIDRDKVMKDNFDLLQENFVQLGIRTVRIPVTVNPSSSAWTDGDSLFESYYQTIITVDITREEFKKFSDLLRFNDDVQELIK